MQIVSPLARGKQRHGFTLVELGVVVSITALLAVVSVGSSGRSRVMSRDSACLNNARQLAAAWQLYADDHQGRAVNNISFDEALRNSSQNWVNTLATWDANPLNGWDNQMRVLLTQTNTIFSPYTGHSATVYKCPADTFISGPQRQRGWKQRPRSVSMNAILGQPSIAQPLLPGNPRNPLAPAYRQFLSASDVTNPAATFVTIDEHPDSINDGIFQNLFSLDSGQWSDWPASYHSGGGAGLSFADGHSEIHHWSSARTKIPVRFNAPFGGTADAASRLDFRWLQNRTGLQR